MAYWEIGIWEIHEVLRRVARGEPQRAIQRTHTKELVSLDFFTVSTVRFHVLFVLILLAHDRRRVVYFNITQDPTARWTA
jgi:hypothetical protein